MNSALVEIIAKRAQLPLQVQRVPEHGLVEQLSTLPFNIRGFTNEIFVLLAERLAASWPGNDGRLFLVPGGAAGVELALALARVHTGRYKSTPVRPIAPRLRP